MTDTPETLRAFAARCREMAEQHGVWARYHERKQAEAISSAESCERKADALENQPENIGATG